MNYGKENPTINAGVTTETLGTAGAGTAGIPGTMGDIRQDLTGLPQGLQHIDHSQDPLFQQLVQNFTQWGQQTGLAPEQVATMFGQVMAYWCAQYGQSTVTQSSVPQGPTGIGFSFLHQFTAFLPIYSSSGLGSPTAVGSTTQQLETVGAGGTTETSSRKTGI